MSMCVCAHARLRLQCQKKSKDPLELGLQAVGIHPTRLLETELQVSVRASSTRLQILKSRENSSTGKQHIKLKDEQPQLGNLCFLYRSRS